jgi:hypothetical protein
MPAGSAISTVRVTALRLLGRWTAIAQGHVALSTGCTCGVASGNLRVQDFEEQILDYLQSKHGPGRIQAASVDALLRTLALPGDLPLAAARSLLQDLERTIDSFEQQHSGR